MKYFNKLAHFAIGIYVGYRIDKPIAPLATATFLAYQAIEVKAKGDRGYPEVKEFGIGIGIGRTTYIAVNHPRLSGGRLKVKQYVSTLKSKISARVRGKED